MNGDPKRWLDDDNAPASVRAALQGSRRARPLDEDARVRVGKKVARLSILPVSLLTWLGAKSALAALGAAAGIATMGVVTLATRGGSEPPTPAVHPVEHGVRPVRAPHPVASTTSPNAVPAPVPEPDALVPPVPAAPPTARSAAAPSAAEPKASGGLAEETAFLERARRTLATDPAFALLLVREHALRFPHGKLGAEQSLIEIEALYRSGRHAEARALAERKLASGAGDLYAERVRALLERMDASR